MSFAYLRFLTFLPAILIPACASSSPAFCMIYSACKLNKQGENIQHWCTPFLIWKQSIVPCLILTVASWPAYRFFRRQVRRSGIPISLRIFHSLLWSIQRLWLSQWSRSRCFFLKFSCFFNDPVAVGNLISGSSAFSKSSLNVWKFTVHVLLKPSLENFEHYFASMWNQCNCMVVWIFFGIAFLGGLNENIFFSPAATAEFSKFADVLSRALWQHHLLVFEIAQLESHHLH